MSIERPANERLALYERFKQSLAKGGDDDFFDADDLIIIIDQAVDLEDEYVQIEALMRGYRFFPDNEELTARRAFLYYDLNIDDGVDNMRARMSSDLPMTAILNLRRMEDSGDPELCCEKLDRIVGMPGMFDDETIIQLVDCASSCNCFHWLKANEKKLRTKTDYLPTLLYELFIVSDIHSDHEYSLKLLEELTELEPFNIDFWNALAQIQATAPYPGEEPDLDGALTSTDFALAIESDNEQALTLKASILLQQDNPAGAADTLTPLIGKMTMATTCEIYARALYDLGRLDEASQRLQEYCTKFAGSRDLHGVALSADEPWLPEALLRHYQATADKPDAAKDWFEWARAYYREGRLREASQLLEVLRSTDALDYRGSKLYITALYCLGQYDRCIEMFNDILDRTPELLTPSAVIAGTMSYLHKGSKREAKKAMKKLMGHFPMTIKDDWTLASNLESIGMSHFMTAVQATIDTPGPIDIEDLNIFQFPNAQSSES